MELGRREEEAYLAGLTEELKAEAERLAEKMRYYSDASGEHLRYYWEEKSEFDGYEALFNRLILQQLTDAGEKSREQFLRIGKLLDSPYFARIDFREAGEQKGEKIYIGKFTFWNQGSDYVIYDWRAPIAGMYYEFEYGDAWYDAPAGRVSGYIDLKRQYRIQKGVLEYLLESSLSIGDEILQQELAKGSDRRMRDIVATIQREQNRLIRNESAQVLIVQGAAGSGKTSIALHRVAYFLYRYRGEIGSENFLILSPNGIFVDYISGVLPELGEETIRSISMDDIAGEYLPAGLKAELLCCQAEDCLEASDEAWLERNVYKGTMEFLKRLERYLDDCDTFNFTPENYPYEGGFIEAEYIRRNYARRKAMPLRPRLAELAGVMAEEIRIHRKARGAGCGKVEILEWLMSKVQYSDAISLYREFYRRLGKEELFVWEEGGKLECADVFPLIYIRLYLEGSGGRNAGIKYLIVDEMQDYTPVQYAVLNRLFPCRKTILGDFAQRIVPFGQSSVEVMREMYPGAEVIEINKSYRSTFEIMEFAKRIRREFSVSIEPVQRHGEEPRLIRCADIHEERERLLKFAEEAALAGGSAKLGIICKSLPLAEELYQWLTGHMDPMGRERLHLLTYDSAEFYDGVMVTAVSMSKGLEFDEVILPDADECNYGGEYGRGLLYVACTRAMHRLTLLWYGDAPIV